MNINAQFKTYILCDCLIFKRLKESPHLKAPHISALILSSVDEYLNYFKLRSIYPCLIAYLVKPGTSYIDNLFISLAL